MTIKKLFSFLLCLTLLVSLLPCAAFADGENDGQDHTEISFTDGEDADEGDPDGEEPGEGDPDGEEPGEDDPDGEEPGEDAPDGNEPGEDAPDGNEPGEGDPDGDENGEAAPESEEPGEDDPDGDENGEGDPDGDEDDEDDPEDGEPVWTYANGILIFSGSGTVENDPSSPAPWYEEYSSEVGTVIIEDGVTGIGSGAFAGCTALESVILSAGVTFIGAKAFSDCPSLRSIDVDSGSTAFRSDNGVLFTADGAALLVYPAAAASAAYTVPDGTATIAEGAFASSLITSAVLPKSVRTVCGNAFAGCSLLTTVRFRGSAPDSIADSAFAGVTATVLYSSSSGTWTEENMRDYGGELTWEIFSLAAPGITGVYNYAGYMKVVWEPVANAEMYRLSYREGTGPWEVICLTPSTRVNVYDIEDGTVCTFIVECCSKDGSETYSSQSVRIGQIRLTTPEITVTPYGGKTDAGGFRVSWNATTGGSCYKIYYRETGGVWALYALIPKSADTLFCNIKANITNADSARGSLLPDLCMGHSYQFMVLTATSQTRVTSGFPTDFETESYISGGSLYQLSDDGTVLNVLSGGSILLAVQQAYALNVSTVAVHEGTYDILKEYTDCYGSTYFDSYRGDDDGVRYNGLANGHYDCGIWLNGLNLICDSGVVVTAYYDGSNPAVSKYFSAFSVGSNAVVEGLDVECTNLRYAVHADYHTDTANENIIFRGCTFINDSEISSDEDSDGEDSDGENSDGEDSDARKINCTAFGCGLGSSTRMLLENCSFIVLRDRELPALLIHNNAWDGAQSDVTLQNCTFTEKGYADIRYHGTSTLVTTVTMKSCTWNVAPKLSPSLDDDTTVNMHIYIE